MKNLTLSENFFGIEIVMMFVLLKLFPVLTLSTLPSQTFLPLLFKAIILSPLHGKGSSSYGIEIAASLSEKVLSIIKIASPGQTTMHLPQPLHILLNSGKLVIGFPTFIDFFGQAVSHGLQGISSRHSITATGPLLSLSSDG